MTQIYFQGNPIQTNSDLPSIGQIAPDFYLVNQQLQTVTLANYINKRKILHIVPSIDTPTCALSTRKFNEKAAHLLNTVILIISADLPFAQARFCEMEGLNHLIFLSTFRSQFAQDYGLLLIDGLLAGLTARAVFILDTDNKILYTELVSELTDEPNYNQALAIFKS
ncbi:MAG: hypothetical protein RL637_706 [Pseudomonadota bacterium]